MDIKDKIILDLKKNYGEKSIITASQLPDWKVVPLRQVPYLDYQLGGGLLVGRFNMITGLTNSGKTSLAYCSLAAFQKLGVSCYYFDLDRFYMPERAVVFGVDNDKVTVISEDLTSEIVIEMIKMIIRGHNASEDKRCYIIIDSLAAMASDKTIEAGATDGYATKDALANNHGYKVWNSMMSRNSTILVLQQYRENLKMGEDNKTPGGMAQGYYSANIFEVRQGQTHKDGTKPIGQEIKWTIKKSKTAAPKQTGVANFYFETGFDTIESLILTAVDMDIIKQSGAFFTDGEEKYRGKAELVKKLREDKIFVDSLFEQVYAAMNIEIWDGSQIIVKEESNA